MSKIEMEKPLTYEEAKKVYEAAKQIKKDFIPVSYFTGENHRKDAMTEQVIINFRQALLKSCGVDITGRDELLEAKSAYPLTYCGEIYRDPLEAEQSHGYYKDIMETFMEDFFVSEYDLRPAALLGLYLFNKRGEINIRNMLNALKAELADHINDSLFYYDYITFPYDSFEEAEDFEDEDESMKPQTEEEQRKALCQFIDEYLSCLDGHPVKDTCYVNVMKKFVVEMWGYEVTDATFLAELGGLCILCFGESNSCFMIEDEVYMYGNAKRRIYQLEDKELVQIMQANPECEEVQIITWCLDRLCESGQQAYASYLNALNGWRYNDEGIELTYVECTYTDLSDNVQSAMSSFSHFMAPFILDTVVEHLKAIQKDSAYEMCA